MSSSVDHMTQSILSGNTVACGFPLDKRSGLGGSWSWNRQWWLCVVLESSAVVVRGPGFFSGGAGVPTVVRAL